LNLIEEDMLYISVWKFLVVLQVGVGYAFFSLHTHFIAYHEWGPIPGSVKLRNRGVV